MFDRIDFLLSEAFVSIRRNMLMTVAAIVTVCASLLPLCGFAYAYITGFHYVASLPSQFEVRVYLKDGVDRTNVEAVSDRLHAEPGVTQVDFISKDDAWTKMKAAHPEIPLDLDNPLPDAFTVKFKDFATAAAGAADIRNISQVDKALYQKDLLQAIQNGLNLFRYVGFYGLALLVISGVIIFNSIAFTIHARRTEIRIMKLVGASYFTIKAPFLIEGIFQGGVGGLLAAGALILGNTALARFASQHGLSLPPFPEGLVIAGLGIGGALIGGLCSGLSLRSAIKTI